MNRRAPGEQLHVRAVRAPPRDARQPPGRRALEGFRETREWPAAKAVPRGPLTDDDMLQSALKTSRRFNIVEYMRFEHEAEQAFDHFRRTGHF